MPVFPAMFGWSGQFSVEMAFSYNKNCLRYAHFFHSIISVGSLANHQEPKDLFKGKKKKKNLLLVEVASVGFF